MDKELKEWHFDFGVYYITENQAGDLLDKITSLVEELGAYMGGGYHEYAETTKTTQDES